MTALDCAPDAELVQAIGQERPEALEELYRRHSAAAFAVARRVTNDPLLAEEVLQEIFLRLWRAPDRFDASRGTLRAFLIIDTRARAIEVVRSSEARRSRERRTLEHPAKPAVDVEREVLDLLLAEHLQEALDSLAPGEREAIELAYFGSHTYREVAQILGEPEGTVKSRIRTGLLRLRDRLLAIDGGATWRT